jgi:hypothetical protein
VADEEDRDPLLLRQPEEPPGGLADLADGAGSRAEVRRVERLHRVDHRDLGALALERGDDLVQVRLREDADLARAAQPVGTELHLRGRLLAGDEDDRPLGRELAKRHEEEGRLADPGVARDEDEAGRDQSAAEDAVELGNAGREALRVRGLDLDETQHGTSRGGPPAARGRGRRTLLGEGAPGAAARAAPEPLPGRVPAFRARVLNRSRLRHGRSSVGPARDVTGASYVPEASPNCVESVPRGAPCVPR